VLERALAAASAEAGWEDDISGTASVTSTVNDAVRRAWSRIESWLRDAASTGVDQARAGLHNVTAEIESLIRGAGAAGDQVRMALLTKLASFTQNYVQSALSCLPTSLIVGGTEYKPKTVKVTHKLVVTGSIALALDKALELVGSSEMEVGIEYE